MEGQPKVRSSPKCWKSTGDRAPLRSNCPPVRGGVSSNAHSCSFHATRTSLWVHSPFPLTELDRPGAEPLPETGNHQPCHA
jgi:hypothetical protein